MPPTDSNVSDRREFFRRTLRFAALTGIVGVAASAVARRGPLTGPGCTRQDFCRGCTKLPACGESQAQAVRQNRSSTGGKS